MKSKCCSKCGDVFPLTSDYWHISRSTKDGFQYKCKQCAKQCAKHYYIEHREYRLEQIRKYQQTSKGKEVSHKTAARYHTTLRGYLNQVYGNIKQRCNNPKIHNYYAYGGRGIQCKFTSFQSFYRYITQGLGITKLEQVKGLQIDRTDNDGHYEKGNLRFCTHKENINNRKKK